MATLDQTFKVNVFLKTGGVSRRSFNEMLFIGPSQRRQSSAKVYADLDAVAVDYRATDAEYLAAQAVFSQVPKPSKLTIGTRYSKAVITVPTVANNTVYSVRINGTLFSITSDADATAAEILTALNAVINPAAGINSTIVGSTLEVASDALVPFSVQDMSSNLAVTFSPVTSWTATFPQVRQANDKWYAVATTGSSSADIQEIAAIIAALPNRTYYSNSADAAIIAAPTTDVYGLIGATSNNRAVGFYRPNDGTSQRFAAGAMAAFNVHEPGSITLKFVNVVGFTPDVIMDPTNLDAKRVNYYTELSTDTSVIQEGKALGGEFIDVIRDTDYVAINLRDDLLQAFVNNTKVPYNARGLALVEGVVRARMQDAFTREIFDPADTTFVFPTMADTLAADRAARILRGIVINTRAVGAIHFVDGVNINVGA